MVALVEWVGNDLRNTANFTAAQSLQSTANSAAEIALQNMRYNFVAPTLNASPPVPCWTAAPSPSLLLLNSQSVDAWCSTQWTIGTLESRLVTVSVCPSTTSALNCANSPLLQVIVTFKDFDAKTGSTSCGPVSGSVTTCGTTMSIDSWAFGVQPPQVSAVTVGSNSCPTGNPLKIQGSNLTGASNISFVMTSLASSNEVYSASSYSVINDTTLTACTPSLGSGTAYVVVTTPQGSSAFGPTFTF